MPSARFEPSSIKNKVKRQETVRKLKREKGQKKLQSRLAIAKAEVADPGAKRKRLAQNVPNTLDNQREFDPSVLTADPRKTRANAISTSSQPTESSTGPSTVPGDDVPMAPETSADIDSDQFASYFSDWDPDAPPKVLVTTSPKATKVTYNLCEELVDIFPGAEFIRRKKGRGFEIGRIAGWAADRGYQKMLVVNEDVKKPNAITLVHLPNGPTAYFKLTSIELSKRISGHARSTAHFPELVLNNFVTRLGHTVGRMFQTMFPPMPQFQGRQVVTLHNQRDFLFFRRHRYAFRSTEKAALQEIGPRFTLKLRSLRTGLPAVKSFGEPSTRLEFDEFDDSVVDTEQPGPKSPDQQRAKEVDGGSEDGEKGEESEPDPKDKTKPPTVDEYQWQWKPKLETTRRTFFL
ncbi:Brix-domain-containing protein [Thelephora terrestris]|uniref:Brix-domain-containing protein n=1 Tax=Thelephora terrestris TaxID=56493 RepID=A0A9P6L7X3_9AGAM|nr:Brix-domain-containing protein [Thelephora terrestris]